MLIGKKGFSILEVLIGMAVFMIGMLGIAMLLVSSIKGEAFSSKVSEATMLARSTYENLMSAPYDPDDDGTLRRLDDINNAAGDIANFDGNIKKTIDPDVATETEHEIPYLPGKNGTGTNYRYRVFYNICEDCLIPDTKSVRLFVRWREKGEDRTVDYYGVIPRS